MALEIVHVALVALFRVDGRWSMPWPQKGRSWLSVSRRVFVAVQCGAAQCRWSVINMGCRRVLRFWRGEQRARYDSSTRGRVESSTRPWKYVDD
jgi:hypothetical protein